MELFRLRRSVWILAIITLASLSGCEFKDVRLDKVESFEINKLQEGKLDATINVQLTNPNSYPITIKSGSFDIYMGKTHMGDAKLSKAFKIQASSTESYAIDVDGTMGDMIAAGITGLAGLLTGKAPEMTVKGELKAGNFFFTRKVPVEVKTTVPIDRN